MSRAVNIVLCLSAISISTPVYSDTWLDSVLSSLQSSQFNDPAVKKRGVRKVLAQFQGFLFPLNIQENRDQTLFQIQGKTETCFEFVVKGDSSIRTGYVAYIDTEDPTCALPEIRKGSFLLELVDWISMHGGLSVVRLNDESKVRCGMNDEWVDLPFLRILQKGQSWYGSHGYFPESEYRSEYQESLQNLAEYTLDQFQRGFPMYHQRMREYSESHPMDFSAKYIVINLDQQYGDLQSWIQEFEVRNGKGRHLREFFSWVWQVECAAYSSLVRMVFPRYLPDDWYQSEDFSGGLFGWIGSAKKIELYGTYLAKQFKPSSTGLKFSWWGFEKD